MHFEYRDTDYPIRNDIVEAHREAWRRIARPGCWWNGPQRVAIAAETRVARACPFCAERKQALSPYAVSGQHDRAQDALPDSALDAVHRICTDQTRITEDWLRKLDNKGLSDGHYAELLGIVVAVLSIDVFHIALGIPLEPLPQATAGEPSNYRPGSAKPVNGWLPTITKNASRGTAEEDLYQDMPIAPSVIAAMSLVPDSVRLLKLLAKVHYLSEIDVGNPVADGGRALTRPQIELVASRVSAINECFF